MRYAYTFSSPHAFFLKEMNGEEAKMRGTGLIVVSVGLLLAGTACTATSTKGTASRPPSASSVSLLPTSSPMPAHTVAQIPVGPQPDGLDAAFGSLWVAEHHNYAVQRIDAKTNTIVATITVGNYPSEVVHGFGYEWVLDYGDRRAWRIDPATNHATDFAAGGYGDGVPAAGLGSLWVSVDNGGSTPSRINRIDPHTLRITDTLRSCGNNCLLTVSEERLWVASQSTTVLQTYDPATKVWRTVTRLGSAVHTAIGRGVAYVTRQSKGFMSDSDIIRVDTATGRGTKPVIRGSSPIALIDGSHVWIVDRGVEDSTDGRIFLLDPKTLKASLYTSLNTAVDSMDGAIVAYGSLWVADWTHSVVFRIAEPS